LNCNRSAHAIQQLTGVARRDISDPHLSLLYKSLSVRSKQQLGGCIHLRFSEVSFDSVSAVRCSSPTNTTEDVRAWQLLATS